MTAGAAVRHVLVTGAASGIGRAVARDFAAEGARVTAVDRDVTGLDEAVAELAGAEPAGAEPAGAAGIVADLADPDAACALAGRAGDADVLVNAAGIYPAVPLLEMTPDRWDRVLDVNLRAAMLTTVGFARALIARGATGAVVNISSGAALRSRPGAAHYCTSKAGLETLTRSCAVELGEHGIRVNAVAPGFVDVDSTVNPVTEEYAAAVSGNPLGRRGRPEDIARAVRWLAGEDAAWVSGAVLRVDGGASAGTTALPLHWTRPVGSDGPVGPDGPDAVQQQRTTGTEEFSP